jgi:hypothetical protein
VEQWEDKKGMETILPQKKNLIQDSEENEENRYPVPDTNKTKTNNAKEPNDPREHPERINPANNH